MPKHPNLRAAFADLGTQIVKDVEGFSAPKFIPTGMLEPVIIAVGNAKHRIVNAQTCNKAGKTTVAINIMRNIFWEPDLEYFDYPAYHEWPFTNDDGLPIKRARILCTPQNATDSGPIREEMRKWWPRGRYTEQKAGKNYYCQYETDTGWFIDVMTYEQQPSELEGPMISLQWCDEPPKARLMGAMMSRYSKGGILLMSQTPVAAGAVLDVVNDLHEKGATVLHVNGSVYDNSITGGKENLKGTKRGLMTNDEISEYVNSIPLDEQPSRVYGKNIGRSGKIYSMYNDEVHTRHYELDSNEARQWMTFMIMDPHDKYYPFMQWWAVKPGPLGVDHYVCYNEWPMYETLKCYYDEVAKTLTCNMTPDQLAQIIKTLDCSEYGLQTPERGIDPRFARNSKADFAKKSEGIILTYTHFGINFKLPPSQMVDVQREKIRGLLKYEHDLPITIYNEPKITICPWCRNTRRSIGRHYWEEGKEVEAETFKDPADCARMFFALLGERRYQKPASNVLPKVETIRGDSFLSEENLGSGLHEIALA